MTNDFKEEMYKQLNEFKENMNSQREFKQTDE
jgi:hypothetical protein